MRTTSKNSLTALVGLILAIPFAGLSTPAPDPICAAPSSLIRVEGVRLEMAREASNRRSGLRRMGPLSTPQLSFDGWDSPGGLRWSLTGPAGDAFHLESKSELGPNGWTPAATLVFGSQSVLWRDGLIATQPQGFFRLASADPALLTEPVNNFRLLDHEGKAHDLFYSTHRTAIVVVEAGDDLQQIAPVAAMLQQFATVYTNQIEIWILLADPTAIRTNVAAQVKAMGLNLPVLDDRDGLAALAVGLTRTLDVAVIEPPAFTVAYRGAMTDGSAAPPDQGYLGQALASLTNGASLTFLRAAGHGAPLLYASQPTPDYEHDIAPMLHQHCAICHLPGGVAPFALTNFSVVNDWAPVIRHAVASGKMPPWHADPAYGSWSNNLALSGPAKSALLRWIDAGLPRGNGPDPLAELPLPPSFTDWPADLGEPDALVTIPIQQIKASGTEDYRYVFVQLPNPTNVWLRAAAVRPSNVHAVHHYLVWLGRIGNSGTPGVSTYESAIAEYVPGFRHNRFPQDAGVSLTRSNWVTFNLHYTPYGEATTDQPVLALWYHSSKPAKKWHSNGIGGPGFVIPPGSREYPVQAEWTADHPIRLHRLNPHMHLRGKRMSYEAFYPNGTREMLLSVPDYDFNWQTGYDLAEPKSLPTGTRIVVRGAFDNSPQNLSNPDPTKSVIWGDQSSSEMLVGFFDFVD